MLLIRVGLAVIMIAIATCREPFGSGGSPTQTQVSSYYPTYIYPTRDNALLISGFRYFYGGDNDASTLGFILKVDGSGNLIWVEDNLDSISNSIVKELMDGSVVMVSRDYKGYNIVALMLDNGGNKIWRKTYDIGATHSPFDFEESADGTLLIVGAYSVLQDDDDGWGPTGKINSNPPIAVYNVSDIWGGGSYYTYAMVLKTDRSGNYIQHRNFDYSGFSSIVRTSDGNFIISGSATLKIDPNINTIWTKSYNGIVRGNGNGEYVIATISGNMIYFYKINESGDSVSQFAYSTGCSGNVYGSFSPFVVDSIYYVLTYVCNAGGNNVPYFVKVDESGNDIWKVKGPRISGTASYIAKTSGGNYMAVMDDNGLHLIKLDVGGNIIWEKKIEKIE